MINIPKIDNQTFKIQAARQIYSKQIVFENFGKTLNSTFAKQDSYFKALAYQVLAMAEQDKNCPTGKCFNIFA